MSTLRFSFGTMGSGKSTMALQIHHNLASRELYGLLLTMLDREGAQVTSRLGVAAEAIDVSGGLDLYKLAVDHWPLHYLVCDEAQFYTSEQCDQLGRVVDDLGVDVFAFGLITDFRGELFDGHQAVAGDRRRAGADAGRGALLVRGAGHAQRPRRQRARSPTRATPWWSATPRTRRRQPLFGDVVRYELLCRAHYRAGELGYEHRRLARWGR